MGRWLIVVTTTVAVTVAGCSGQTAGSGVPSSPTAASSTASPAGQGALTAYKSMWTAFSAAGETSDWRSPDLARYATGNALDQLVRSLQADEVQGIVTKGPTVNRPVVMSAIPASDPTDVRIQDCGDDSGTRRIRASDGHVLAGAGGQHRIDADVRTVDGVWKVVDFRLRAAGTC